ISDAQLHVRSEDIGPLLRLIDAETTGSGRLSIEGQVSKAPGPWGEAYQGLLDVKGQALQVNDQVLGTLACELRVDDRVFDLPTFSLQGEVAQVEARMTLDASRPVGEQLTGLDIQAPVFDLKIPSLAALSTALATVVTDMPALGGRLRLQGSLNKPADRAWTELDAEVTTEGRDLMISDFELGALDMVFKAEARQFAIRSLGARGAWGELESKGHADFAPDGSGRGVIDALVARLDQHPLTLRNPAQVTWTATGDFALDEVELEAFAGTIAGRMSLSETIDLDFSLNAIDLAALPASPGLSGLVDGRLVAKGSLDAPDLDLQVEALGWGWRDLAGAFQAKIRGERGRLSIETLRWTVPEFSSLIELKGRLPARVTRAGLEALPWSDAALEFRAQADDVTLAHQFGAPEELSWQSLNAGGRLDSGVLTAQVTLDQALWKTKSAATDFPVDIRIDARADETTATSDLVVNGLRDLIIKGQAALDQGLGTAPDAALLDRLRDAGLNGNLTVRAPDLASFRDLVPGVLRLGGQLVVDVELAGTAAAPEPSGRLEVDDFRFRLEGDLPGLDKGVIKARFDPKTIDIERADGQIGFSPLAIRGTVAIPRAGNDAAFDLVITGENTLLARSRY
ncbi:MAG: hypothetical protein KDB53_09555, partial [Planctomycetes bacterium]|nr:hypothetical protein [Planctomycetota bacterium]